MDSVPATYPVVLGRLARPALLAQAITPLAGGLLVEHYGARPLLISLAGLALLNIGVTALIRYRMDHPMMPRSIKPVLSR